MKKNFLDFFINKLSTLIRALICLCASGLIIITYLFIKIKVLEIIIYLICSIILVPTIMTVFLDLFGTRTNKGTPLKTKLIYQTNDLEALDKVLLEHGFKKDENNPNHEFIIRYERLNKDVEESINLIYDFFKYQKWVDSLSNLSAEEVDNILANNKLNDQMVRLGLSLEIILFSEQFSELNFEEFCQKVAIHNQIYFNGFLSIYLSYQEKELIRYTKLPRPHRQAFNKLLKEIFISEENKNGN